MKGFGLFFNLTKGRSKVPSKYVNITSLRVVIVDSILQPLQKVWDRGGNPVPSGDEGNAKRVFHEGLTGQFDAPGKGFYSHPFLMTIKIEAIKGSIIMIFCNFLLSRS